MLKKLAWLDLRTFRLLVGYLFKIISKVGRSNSDILLSPCFLVSPEHFNIDFILIPCWGDNVFV